MQYSFSELGKRLVVNGWGNVLDTPVRDYLEKSCELQDIRCLLAAILKIQLENQKRENSQEGAEDRHLWNRIAAMKGVITKMKKVKRRK